LNNLGASVNGFASLRVRSFTACVSAIVVLLALSGSSTGQAPYTFDVVPPELVGGPSLNTPKEEPIRLSSRKGKVLIVHFWTFGCINCKRNLPCYARWQKRFEKQDVEIIGIHTPETAEEKVSENVVKRVKELGITYPVLLDQKGENWIRWKQRYWPTVYLIDKRGHARFEWEGELDWKGAGGEEKMARKVEALLKESDK